MLRTRLAGSVADLPPEQVPAARERAGRIQAGPAGRVIVGSHDRRVVTEDTVVTTPDVVLPVRVYRPPEAAAVPAPLVVNFHGGGYVQGDLDQSDWFCGQVSLLAGAVVVSVDYRLAPEHPFPVPAQDAYAATAALAAEPGRWGIDASRVAVMGDSAGGNLATVVCLMARDARRRGEDAPLIGAQCLVYPGTEMVDVLPSERAIPRAPILDASDIRGFLSLYLAGADGSVPYASPLRADLTDLPPALVQTAEHDPLQDHGTYYVDALRRAGVPVRHTQYQGAPHGYISMPRLLPTMAHQAAWEVADWARSSLLDAPDLRERSAPGRSG
ncbi:alpha/beta hydrolase [Actinomycetospora endophytica]|uniref:Alpha/beta hydrolase n=1 Tax=Actinomycetospora endophytica TaxID=2291215 RepID=A0ABS8P6Q5_9PSEU|nr:alpha/beta hydrolase [Actinomycetospora endophytica]MCD2193926.1 alpha/beta hydrolase [Actinomycetospora endophytica]